jgi:flagellar M-ring protein FliF
MSGVLNNLGTVLRGLGTVRLALLGGVGLATLGLLGYLALRGGEPPMALLYGELDQRDAASVVAALERARVPHRISRNGAEVMVPEDQVARLRLQLAREGIPLGGSVGYEIFDRGNGLTATPFQQDLNRLRALEGEVARSIRTLQGVAAARVHLVLPRREPFSRERGEAQASVVLQMRGAQRLDREGVQAVLHLVAAAVPGLRPQQVSIVDGRGELLARGGQALAGGQGMAMTTEELRRAQELRIARAVEEMLERSLGQGRVRVEATVELDAERVQTVEERFDPDNQVPRSTQSTSETSRSGEQQNVSVANQLPGAPATQQGGPQSQESRQEETTNFEIGRVTRNTTREHPVLRRQSVAVLVDGVMEPADGTGPGLRFRERTPEELARIATLVRGAIGFDERRGDRLEVVSLRFAEPAMASQEEAAGLVAGLLTPAMLTRLIETGLIAVLGLAALLLVGRPVATRLAASLAPRPAIAGSLGDDAAPAGAVNSAFPGLSAPAEGEALDDLVDIAMVEGQLRASSLQRVATLVEKHPEETLSLMRRWLTPEIER